VFRIALVSKSWVHLSMEGLKRYDETVVQRF